LRFPTFHHQKIFQQYLRVYEPVINNLCTRFKQEENTHTPLSYNNLTTTKSPKGKKGSKVGDNSAVDNSGQSTHTYRVLNNIDPTIENYERKVLFLRPQLNLPFMKQSNVIKIDIDQVVRYIFASNHPLGGLDGMATGMLIGKEYDGKVRFFSNDLLTNLEPLKEMFIPVNKLGSQSRQHAKMMDDLYNSENHLVTYPAGMCSRKINGKIVDPEWKKNFIAKAVQYQRDVVPIYFEGRNSNFFYNLARIRKFLGIKFNIEMMYLADEMFKQRGSKFTLTIGKPIPWQTFDKSKTQSEWAAWVKELVYKLKNGK